MRWYFDGFQEQRKDVLTHHLVTNNCQDFCIMLAEYPPPDKNTVFIFPDFYHFFAFLIWIVSSSRWKMRGPREQESDSEDEIY